MAGVLIPISTTALGSSAASVTFSSIPQTYTDLVVRFSSNGSGSLLKLECNTGTSDHSYRDMQGNGSTATSGNVGYGSSIIELGKTSTATNVFGNAEVYLANYATAAYKPIGAFVVSEANATTAYTNAIAALWSNTSGISSLKIGLLSGSFTAGSTFTLYGIL